MNVVQRFGSALDLNVHFHALVLDGVYATASPFARPVFHPAPELEDAEVAHLVQTLRDRIVRLLRRRGLWPTPGEDGGAREHEHDSLLPFLSAASIQGRVALGPDAGRRIERLGHAPSDTPLLGSRLPEAGWSWTWIRALPTRSAGGVRLFELQDSP